MKELYFLLIAKSDNDKMLENASTVHKRGAGKAKGGGTLLA